MNPLINTAPETNDSKYFLSTICPLIYIPYKDILQIVLMTNQNYIIIA